MSAARCILATTAAALLFITPAAAAEQVYHVVRVIDADTIVTLEHGDIRFAITAAPEMGARAPAVRGKP
jgi:hypothetical protein